MKLLPRTLHAALCLITHNASAADTTADTILILDASNSTWGRIEGRAIIEIAREAVGGILAQWNTSRPLGVLESG